MKKISIFILTMSLILFTGCGNDAKNTKPETTEIFDFATISQSGVLLNNSRYFEFYDFATDRVVCLCNKPGCLHTDTECNGFCEGAIGSFFYNDSLYYFTNRNDGSYCYDLYKASLYGENRQKVTGGFDGSPMSCQMQLSKNHLIYVNANVDKKVDFTLYDIDLTNGSHVALDVTGLLSNELYGISISDFVASDERVIVSYTGLNYDLNDYFDSASGELSGVPWDELMAYQQFVEYNLKTKEIKNIKDLNYKANEVSFNLLSLDGDVLTYFFEDKVYQYNIAKGQETVVFDLNYSGDLLDIVKVYDDYVFTLLDDNYEYYYVIISEWKDEKRIYGESAMSTGQCIGYINYGVFFRGDYGLSMIAKEDYLKDNFAFVNILKE